MSTVRSFILPMVLVLIDWRSSGTEDVGASVFLILDLTWYFDYVIIVIDNRVYLMKGYNMVTKKDFKTIAEIIEHEFTRYDNTGEDDTEGKSTTASIAGQLAGYFTTQDPYFDQQKFLNACGL